MKMDERIIDGARPFTQYDTDKAKEYLNKECYFSDHLNYFVDVKRYCSVGKLVDIIDNGEFPFKIADHDSFYAFCLPCELEKQPATTKFVPYTLDTWKQDFKPGDIVVFCGKENTCKEGNYCECIYSGYMKTPGNRVIVILGPGLYSFDELFKLYEIRRNGYFEPFGILEK